MAAAAVASRAHLRRSAPGAQAAAGALAFDELGGPLLAVCGLAGGAGTSTLALLLAREVAASSTPPILLTETDPLHGGLAALTGRATPHPLIELARHVAEHEAPGETFGELEPGLRLIAAQPRHCAPVDRDALLGLLAEARAAHGLVTVDCATSWTHDSPILAAATHILWSTPATRAGIARAAALLASDVLPPAGRSLEVLVAIAHQPRPPVSIRALRRLANRRCDRLVLIPYSAAAARGEHAVDEPIVHALTGLACALRRTR
jgi:MinD-like ATPase involved in chromosome partitioning or flagellar assembly